MSDEGHDAGDEIGAARWVDQAAVRRGLAAVESATSISLAVPIEHGRGFGLVGRAAPVHLMLRSGADYAAGLPERGGFGFADDVVTLATHGATHVDALAHVWQDGRMYNDISAHRVTSRGAASLGIENMPPLVTRGVVVDASPGSLRAVDEPVHVDELVDLVAATGVTIEPGDALLVRTGWLASAIAGESDGRAWPGLHHDCADWLAERRVCVVGADNPAVEVFPSYDPHCQVPMHIALLRDHGIYLAELMALDALCTTGRPTFLFILAALPLVGAVGSPVAPVAVV